MWLGPGVVFFRYTARVLAGLAVSSSRRRDGRRVSAMGQRRPLGRKRVQMLCCCDELDFALAREGVAWDLWRRVVFRNRRRKSEAFWNGRRQRPKLVRAPPAAGNFRQLFTTSHTRPPLSSLLINISTANSTIHVYTSISDISHLPTAKISIPQTNLRGRDAALPRPH